MRFCWSSIKILGISLLLSTVLLSPTTKLQGEPNIYKEGPVHEAFMTPSTEAGLLLPVVPRTPPAPIKERQPPKCHTEAIWIAGYWAWIEQLNDFVWVSGVWRRPVEGRAWISGYWYQYRGGWTWIHGFWSTNLENELRYINERPPQTKTEEVPKAPGPGHFWMPGYWEYNTSSGEYKWLSGQWFEFNTNWVYVPGYYSWRPEGYIWISSYWDFALEDRGCAYATIKIPEAERGSISFKPSIVLAPEQVIRWCLLYYPDFTIFLIHHWHFHPTFWENWCCAPPWWHWESCWCFNWTNNWALWWWWTHPGFPPPAWITMKMASSTPPPSETIIHWIETIAPPLIISPWGIIDSSDLMKAIVVIMGDNTPIMPADSTYQERIIKRARPPIVPGAALRPSGKPNDNRRALPRPVIEGSVKVGTVLQPPAIPGGALSPPPTSVPRPHGPPPSPLENYEPSAVEFLDYQPDQRYVPRPRVQVGEPARYVPRANRQASPKNPPSIRNHRPPKYVPRPSSQRADKNGRYIPRSSQNSNTQQKSVIFRTTKPANPRTPESIPNRKIY